MKDAAESELEGEVGPLQTGGVIRYRIWPAKRHPVRLVVAGVVVVGATVASAIVFEGIFWAIVVAVGLIVSAAPFFFPTEVALDGEQLNIRQLGTPRTWTLRNFRRLEMSRDVLPRVELLTRARLSPVDSIKGVIVPLPEDRQTADQVLVHLRKWVGRQPTGRFAIDQDHAPEDTIDQDS